MATCASAQSWFSPWGSSWERGWGWRDRERAPRWRNRDAVPRQRRTPRAEEPEAAKAATGPIVAIVSLEDQDIHVYSSEGLLARSRVSTGARGHRTPTGIFSVIQKRRYHESNIYSGAPMPWMQRITWSGIALHGGVVPGYPASHGCIRLTHAFAPRLWAMTKMGARVIISPRHVEPVIIRHPRLPVPILTPAAEAVAGGSDNLTPVVLGAAAGEARQGAASQSDVAMLPAPAPRMDSPLKRARADKAQDVADAKAAEAALQAALAAARRTSVQAREAKAALRKARAQLVRAERRFEQAQRAVEAAVDEDNMDRATEAETAAREALEAARTGLADAEAAEATGARAALDAAAAVKDARETRERSAEALKAWARGLEPISIFVSRKEGRVFVRQGMAPLLDAPVTIREPQRPLGTHVFTSLGEEDGGARLRWSVVTVPDGGTSQSPAEALDRIELSAHTQGEIGNRLWTGASLIISDQGISNETGLGTDFVVLTKP